MTDSKIASPAYVSSTTDTEQYEPFIKDGEQLGEVHWLRKEGPGGSTHIAGLWRHTESTFPFTFGRDETIHALEGELEIAIEGGPTVTLVPGGIYSFAGGTQSTWTVKSPFKKLFVVGD